MRAIVTVALIALASAAAAQSFPAKPVTLICPWPPGGTTDTHLRKFAEVAAKYLGQPVVIENKPGAGGSRPRPRGGKGDQPGRGRRGRAGQEGAAGDPRRPRGPAAADPRVPPAA